MKNKYFLSIITCFCQYLILSNFFLNSNGSLLNKKNLSEYTDNEKIEICKNIWNKIEINGYKSNRNKEYCFRMMNNVYQARKLIPTAEFDLTESSMIRENIENYANMDIYSGNLTEISGDNTNQIESLTNIKKNDDEKKDNEKRNLLLEIPKNFDLRSKEANRKNGGSCITFPDNQGKCANCYNYSALSAIEGAVCRQTGKLIPPLSQQYSLDCWLKNKGVKKACSGGQTFEVFNYALKGKVCTKDSYPLVTYKTGKIGECNNSCNKCVGINNFKWSYTGSNINYDDPWEKIISAIYNYGPVTVSICSLMPGFSLYSGGFYEPPTCGSIWCGTRQVDHAVTLVGYGITTQGKRYYIMKNSWGLNWGNKGFMNISADMCSTFFNPGWVTSVNTENISDYCKNKEPRSEEIAQDFDI